MVNKLSYDKVIKYVSQGFERYIREDGLTISQATSRTIVELEIQTDDYEDVEWTMYLMLAKLGIEHGELRDDIKNIAIDIINSNKLINYWINEGIDSKELEERTLFINDVKKMLKEI